ncbi:hypothetical protein BDB00DRAFT_859416 [Zychaea mexicana]|uniref:uncharacterized protein n=1 Tax=Zychaea mexicana TaxID=64656 RepID=UPI0022FE6630|nr:uncharacterized protein BDB00DRAFT_859416 [Zychaea mexicana]KAI9477102.1 hypothetical protein BDB00DRAFT_859416 [Zychaea mexicana]
MELPHIGKHCSLPNCQTLDFLPITCLFCHETFCGPHGLPADHDCSEWEQVDRRVVQCNSCQNMVLVPEGSRVEQALEEHICRPLDLVKKKKCAVSGCREFEQHKVVVPVHCNGCDKDFCLKHRLKMDHECPSLDVDEKESRKQAAQEKISKTFLKTTTAATGGGASSNKKVVKPMVKKKNTMVELMKMKLKAKGSTSIPLSARIYLHVEFPKECNRPTQPMYFDKTIRVGRMLDMVADACSVKNDNNQLPESDPQRLSLFHYTPEEALLQLDLANKLESALSNTDRILLERLETQFSKNSRKISR